MKKLEEKTKRVHMIVPMSWVEQIDKWRLKQDSSISFSEAVRRTSAMGMVWNFKKKKKAMK
jgi:hypothetical protein